MILVVGMREALTIGVGRLGSGAKAAFCVEH